jgi:hypothetical protein
LRKERARKTRVKRRPKIKRRDDNCLQTVHYRIQYIDNKINSIQITSLIEGAE